MVSIEFKYGQGFGNQLFFYISSRCIALKLNMEFATIGQEYFGAPRWNKKGVYFMDIDLGKEIEADFPINFYREKELKIFLSNSIHDKTIGCNISVYDSNIFNIKNNTLISGNLQSEKYFKDYKDDIKNWLRIKKEYDSYEFYDNNLCVINFRGGEYVGLDELFLNKEYWKNGIKNMKKINPNMNFIVITDDIKAAKNMFSDFPCFHFDLAKDYVSIKNAKYLLLSNSSFAFFPTWTSETLEFVIAPKYWARHNYSNGYWATGQNIYQNIFYQDRTGKLFNANECYEEMNKYLEIHKDKIQIINDCC